MFDLYTVHVLVQYQYAVIRRSEFLFQRIMVGGYGYARCWAAGYDEVALPPRAVGRRGMARRPQRYGEQ